MVRFILEKETTDLLIYNYFPEGGEDFGIIEYQKDKKYFSVPKVSPNDTFFEISIDELNKMAQEINKMKKERGDTNLLTEVTSSELEIVYAGKAISEIKRFLDKGEIPKEGYNIWY